MEKEKLNMYLMTNSKFFPEENIHMLRQKLENADDDVLTTLSTISLKDPTTTLILSLLLGFMGIDRFYIGDIGLGVLKFFTFGCCGILTVIDWFTTYKKAKRNNFNKVINLI